ncbi:MAG TPA: hypothetical protein DCZ41_00145, partial [Firmicutes bacterium]|nr:hypothetical protein [Bacillota bacterium]
FASDIVKKEVMDRNIRFLFRKDEWCLLRLSNTEPCCRIYFEMNSLEGLQKEREELFSFLRKEGLIEEE